MLYTIKYGDYSATVNGEGAELVSLIRSGVEYIWSGHQWKGHAPVLFPIVGRVMGPVECMGKLYEMPKHGFIKNRELKPVVTDESRLVLNYESNQDDLVIYPFSFVFTAEFTLGDGGLTVSFRIENKSDSEMIYQFGWHPAFVLHGEADINEYVLEFDKDVCPTKHLLTEAKFVSGAVSSFPLEDGRYTLSEEEIYTDDTIILSEAGYNVTLISPDTERVLKMTYTDNLPYIAIWKWPTSDARYICLEPWCGIPSDGVSSEIMEEKVTRRIEALGTEVFTYVVECK